MEHKREIKLAEWDDQDVQRIYEILCDSSSRRPSEEHWEGYCARWIVGRGGPSRSY